MTSAAASNGASSLASFTGFGEDAPLELPHLSDAGEAALMNRFTNGSMAAFTEAAASVGYCSTPIHLHGNSQTVDLSTGEVIASYSSTSAPLGVTLLPCGNRRASICPACSRVYARDTFELIRAGTVGGKTVPATIATHPLLFLTLTAPSFGHVHRAAKPGQPATRCRPRDKTRLCAHGRPLGCMNIHDPTDSLVGQPICSDCYDYAGHTIWQWWAPELWRRFTIELRREIAHHLGVKDRHLTDHASIQYAKVAEYQTRGLIHFHALIRLDGPKTDTGYAPAPEHLTARELAALIEHAATHVTYTAPPADEHPGYTLTFGTQHDIKIVRDKHRPDTPDNDTGELDSEDVERVAGYLAKYATKAATGHDHDNTHYRRVREQCYLYAAHAALRTAAARETSDHDYHDPYALISKWAHMLGFRGHFSSKSRHYSITLSRLRRARRRWRTITTEAARTGQPINTHDLEHRLLTDEHDNETTLVIGQWQYIKTGWNNTGDAALAEAAAARAREYHQWKATHKHQNH